MAGKRKEVKRKSPAVTAFTHAKSAQALLTQRKPSEHKCNLADLHIERAFKAAHKLPKGGETRKKTLKIVSRAQDRYEKVCL